MITYKDTIDMMELLSKIAPLERTLANKATDQAFSILKESLPSGKVEGFASGKKVWSWTIPKRWECKKGRIISEGRVLLDIKSHPLHLVNYSRPFKGRVSHEELMKHLFSDPNQPDAIPFVFKYYQDDWGFCIEHSRREIFNSDFYDIEVDTVLEDGNLNVFYDYLPGNSKETFIICSDICHPTQVNDSLTGVAVGIDIMKRLHARKERKYNYLFLALPETIGSIAFLAHHPEFIENTVGGFFSEMLGTNGPMVGQKTRAGNTYFDFLLDQKLNASNKDYKIVDFLKSASNDEKVMDSPGVDIPTFAITRSPYREYHTSDDNMSIIKEYNLRESRDVLQSIIDDFEKDYIPRLKYPGHIFLSGYGLYPNWYDDPTLKPAWDSFIEIMPMIDGKLSVVEIAQKVGCNPELVFYWCDRFEEKGLVKKYEYKVKRAEKNLVGF
jgi:aminopeptidase-like protein